MDVRLMEAGLRRNPSHLDGPQLGHHLLSLLVHLPQFSPQHLHLLLQIQERVLHRGPLGRRYLVQQSFSLALLLVGLQNPAEDVSVDVQGGAHQLHVIASLKEKNS